MMHLNKIILLFVALLFVGYALLIAQAPQAQFFINGKVVEDETSHGLEFVNVAVYRLPDSVLVTGTITNEKGYYSIQVNRGGNYYLSADFIGYQKQIISDISFVPGSEVFNVKPVSLKLATIGIGEVEVLGERPFVSYQIDRKIVDVSRNPLAQGGTAVDALENVPSVNIDIEGNVLLRGSGDYTVLIDGRQSPLSGTDALNQIPASSISQIEIITNPSARYDPDGTAGIINIITKKGKLSGHTLVLNAAAGNSPSRSADVTYSYHHNRFTYTLNSGFNGTQMHMDYFDERSTLENDSLGNEQTSYINTFRDGLHQHGSYFVKGSVDMKISEANQLTLGGNFTNFVFGRSFDSRINTVSIYNEENYQLSSSFFRVNPKIWQLNLGDKHVFNNNTNHYLQADLQYQWGDKKSTDSLTRYVSDENWQAIEPLQADQLATTSENSKAGRLELTYVRPVNEKINFESGYTLRYNAYVQNYARDTMSNGSMQPDYSLFDTADFSRWIQAGWALVKGELYGLQYSAGLRVEHTDQNLALQKDNYRYNYNAIGWYPSFSLAKNWKEGHTLQGSYSKRINRPADFQLNPFPGLSDGYVIWKPNPELKPEQANSFELNYQKSWQQNFVLIETFYRKTLDVMERIDEISGDTIIRTMINLGSETDAGAEIAANFKLSKWWTINPSVTLSQNFLEGTYQNINTQVSGMETRASINNTFFLPTKTRLQIMANYNGPSTEINGTREASSQVSAAVRQEFFDRKLNATFRINDIFSTQKREGFTYTENTTVYSKGQRKGAVFVFSLNYRFNASNDRQREGRTNGGSEQGVEMEF
ncbi:MAG: TonB-dependent receptor [Bacteroidota bacterium]|nr:MAG: TonB-dependent receptor [Bacteroidota bacterium]